VGLSVMTKITGLVLSAMAAQIVFTGVRNFLR
jgi:multiple antibiotic resistance protein